MSNGQEVKTVYFGAVREGKQAVPEDMLKAISDIFLTHGLRSTSMDDICSHLKISKKTLYNYFESKDHVVESVMWYRIKDHNLEKFKSKTAPYSAIQILMRTAQHITAAIKSQVTTNNLDMLKYHPAIYEKVTGQWEKQMREVLRLIFNKGIHEGTIRPEINIELQIYLILIQYRSMNHKPEAFCHLPYSIKELVYTVFENTVRTLATPKGIAEMETVSAGSR